MVLNKDNDENIVLKNSIMLYLMTFARYLFPLLLFPYLTRVLMSEYYGIITYMTSIVNYISMIIDFGFNFSATRKISINRNDIKKVRRIYTSVIKAKIILGIISGIFVSLFLSFVPILRENKIVLIAYYISTVILVFLPDFIYRGLEEMKGITIRYCLSKAITTILTILVVKGPDQLIWIPIFNGVGNATSIVFTWIHLKKKFDISFTKTYIQDSVEEIKESFIFFISTFASTAFTFANILFMGFASFSESDIAYWGVAFQLITLVISLYEPITSSLYPRMVKSRNVKLIKNALVYIVPVILVGVTVCYFGAPFFINIVAGVGYEISINIFRIMLPVLVFTYPAQVLGFPVLGPINKEKYVTISTLIAAVFHMGVLIVLLSINKFTLINIAILRSTTEFVLMLLRIYFYYQNKGVMYEKF
ncbi:oligosaccharide flippase family protein [Fusobacterium perfoetens]|uniref:oligosaccharide flippase family protein n=1 Tax=Fusobacterium perfoetens TaxID=852 RepID=UPI001F464F77|nr:oligosaccharide flippase family protein [Fusobacterium perfoetens]MCF2612840.1 oligosaccharide flippase family protein [Fusobacterium perfoetens]